MSGVEWRAVSAGVFTMGSDPRYAHPPDDDEGPRHDVTVAPFRLGRLPVTNAQYHAFTDDTGHPEPTSWPGGVIPDGQEDVPVTYVSWHDARAFCAWAGGRLPTEAEWEAAATGGDGRLWPWGDMPPDRGRAVFAESIGGPATVGSAPAGASPVGALDMAGNVGEWVSSAYRTYPYSAIDGRESPEVGDPNVVRGGSYLNGADAIRCAYRQPMLALATDTYVGFRAAADTRHGRDVLDWVEVPGRVASIGRDPVPGRGEALADEYPPEVLELSAFDISLTPVTNDQYARFVLATGHRAPAHWDVEAPPAGSGGHPVTYVDFADAAAFCAWSGARLPTEAEWEKAARGNDARRYPWGAEPPDASRAIFGHGRKLGTTNVVGTCLDGASPYGLLDMAGNVWEWVASTYRPYPYRADDGREDMSSPGERVLRGGSYASPAPVHLRCAARSRSYPGRRAPHIGFRLARGRDA